MSFVRKAVLARVVVLAVVLAVPAAASAKIRLYALSEMIANSALIVLVSPIGTEGSFVTAPGARRPERQPRFADYRVLEVLKGDYEGTALRIDYQKTNEKYRPFTCRRPVYPRSDKPVVLFLEKDMVIFQGFQGRIELEKDFQENYLKELREAITAASRQEDK